MRASAGIVAMLCGAVAAWGQGARVGGEFQVNTYTTGGEYDAAVSIGPDGDFVVVWTGPGPNESYTRGIFAQRFDGVGSPLGGEIHVNEYTFDHQYHPSVSKIAGGGFSVVWTNPATVEAVSGVLLRSFGGNGTPLSGELLVNAYTTGIQELPRVTLDPTTGGGLALWSGQNAADDSGISLRAVAGGAPSGAEVALNVYTTGAQRYAEAAFDPLTGNALVVWESACCPPGDSQLESVRARLVDASGTPLGGELAVNTYSSSAQLNPRAAADAAGNFVVVWDSYGSPGSDQSVRSIQARRFDGAGAPLGDQFQVNTTTLGIQRDVAVGVHPGGAFVVTWSDQSVDSGNLKAQRFDPDGVPLADEFMVASYTTSAQREPDVAVVADGDFVIVWHGPTAGESRDTRGQRFRKIGSILAQDLELGSLAGWSSVTAPDGDLFAASAAALAGQFGLEALVDDTVTLFAQDDSPRAESAVRVKLRFDPNGFTVGTDGERVKLLQLISTAPTRRVVTLVLRVQGGQHRLLAKTHLDDESWVNTGFVTITDAAHEVELEWRAVAGAGVLRMWIDGAPAGNLTGLPNGASRVDLLRVGVLGVKPGAGGSLYFDDVEVERLP